MSTTYEIRCVNEIEPERWPADGVLAHNVPALWALIDHRAEIISLAAIGLWITLEGVYDEPPAGFLERHAACGLAVFDEYGRMAERPNGG